MRPFTQSDVQKAVFSRIASAVSAALNTDFGKAVISPGFANIAVNMSSLIPLYP